MSQKTHEFQILPPSPWPFAASASLLCLVIAGIFAAHDENLFGLPHWITVGTGLLSLVLVLFFWWRDIIIEATINNEHTPVVQLAFRYGMLLFIASEVMFFASFFWAYLAASLNPTEAIGFVWPPANIRTFDPMDVPLINTLILLLSGTTVTWAHHAAVNNDRKGFLWGLGITICLGIFFSALQVYEYIFALFGLRDGIYASTFYIATSFHGLHVLIGTIFLIVGYLRVLRGELNPERHFGFEAAAWYWHFVDVVWIFLYLMIYWNVFGVFAA